MCDGYKTFTWRPAEKSRQELEYDGHHKRHCIAQLIWTDICGLFIRLDFTLIGSMHDRGVSNGAGQILRPHEYFSSGESCTCDMGFIGEGPLFVHFKVGRVVGLSIASNGVEIFERREELTKGRLDGSTTGIGSS